MQPAGHEFDMLGLEDIEYIHTILNKQSGGKNLIDDEMAIGFYMMGENPVEFQRNKIKKKTYTSSVFTFKLALIDVIKFELNELSVKKVASTPYHVMRKDDSRGLRYSHTTKFRGKHGSEIQAGHLSEPVLPQCGLSNRKEFCDEAGRGRSLLAI